MRHAHRILGYARVAAVVAALALLLWPLHEPGVTGTAVTPHYRDFGWYGYAPLPAHPSAADFAAAGIAVPQRVVDRRRAVALDLAMLGLVTGSAPGLLRRRKTTA